MTSTLTALRFHVAAALCALVATAFNPAQAQAQAQAQSLSAEPMAWQAVASTATGPVAVKDHDVFVDLPTGFAFVKTPAGWKFVGQLDAAQLTRLPAGTITSLLPPDRDQAPRYAQAVPVTAR